MKSTGSFRRLLRNVRKEREAADRIERLVKAARDYRHAVADPYSPTALLLRLRGELFEVLDEMPEER